MYGCLTPSLSAAVDWLPPKSSATTAPSSLRTSAFVPESSDLLAIAETVAVLAVGGASVFSCSRLRLWL